MIPLNHLVTECAPMVAPSTMAAIVRVESGGNPLAMWNNGTRSRVIPGNRAQAIAYLRAAMAAGQRVDVGLAQVDTRNFAVYGLTPKTAFNACANLRVGAEILRADWRQALRAGMRGQTALYHAFEAYNSGRLRGDADYADRILGAAGAPVFVRGAGLPPHAIRRHAFNPFPQFLWPATQPLQGENPLRGATVSWSVFP